MVGKNNKLKFKIIQEIKHVGIKNKLVIFFFVSHVIFAIFLGRMFAFAPDESGYLFTFNNVYTLPVNTYAQSSSGWNTTPTIFLWIAYLPAKILNLMGVPDFLSIRILSIAMITLSLFLFLKMTHKRKQRRTIPPKLIFFCFFIPSVFFWTSTGLRESFLIFAITLFLVGIHFLFQKKNKEGLFILFVGSYALISVKQYLWVLLMLSVILFSIINISLRIHRKSVFKLAVAGFIAPLILFLETSSSLALSSNLNLNLLEIGVRSGSSTTQIEKGESLIYIEGDSILIALRSYLVENPDSAFTKAFSVFNFDDKIESLWNEKLQAESMSDSKQIKEDISSLNSSVLKPGLITEPWTMLWPSFVFLMGPFPFIGEPDFATKISSFESPLWWLLYLLVIYQFYRFRKLRLISDPAILFALIFLAGEIAFSSLVEVNLGTSFRHRSILLAPLVFIYLRIAQRAHELRDEESKPIL
jgi:hypothetical protein